MSNRQQRTKINNNFSDWTDVDSGVPQGSIWGPFIFNIYVNDMFYFIEDDNVTNFADDNTPFTISDNLDELTDKLESSSDILVKWFEMNYFKMNIDKCKLLVANHESNVYVKIDGNVIEGDQMVKLLGIKVDNKLNFHEHVSTLCKKN